MDVEIAGFKTSLTRGGRTSKGGLIVDRDLQVVIRISKLDIIPMSLHVARRTGA